MWTATQDANGMVHFEQDVIPPADQNIIQQVRVRIEYDINTVLFDNTYTGTGIEDGNTYVQDINTWSYAKWKFFRIYVTVTSDYGVYNDESIYTIHTTTALIDNLINLKGLVGDPALIGGQFGATLIALLITAFAVGALSMYGIGGDVTSFFIGAGILGFFAIVGWVDTTIWILVTALGAAMVYLIRKW